MTTRKEPQIRRKELLKIAVDLASYQDYSKLYAKDIALTADCSRGLVVHYLGTTEEIHAEVMRIGIKRKVLRIVAYGLIHNHPLALAAPKGLREESFQYVATGQL